MALTATQQRGIRAQKTIGENGVEVMTAEVPYLVAGMTTLTQAAHEVTQATGLPAIGSVGHGAVCIGYRIQQPDEGTATSSWRVWVRYGQWPAGAGSDPENHDPNPVNRPPVITRRVVERSEMLFHDFDNPPKAIVNVLGHPFDPGLEGSKYRLAITVQRYVSVFASLHNLISGYVGKVNQDPIQPFAARTLLCRDIEEVMTREGSDPATGLPYHVVAQTISLEVDPGEWIVEVLNRGPEKIVKEDGQYIKTVGVVDDNGVATGEIVLLDDQGNQITWQEIANGMQPHFIPFVMRETSGFQLLNLPSLTKPVF